MSSVVRFDFSDFERAAKQFRAAADQIPFALAQSLNDATAAARQEIVTHTWPDHVEARNKSFIGAALRREFASKRNLRAGVVENGPAAGRGNLSLHEDGGARRARRANLAIPVDDLKAKRTGKGVPKGLRPRAIPNAFVPAVGGRYGGRGAMRNDILVQRVGTYKKASKGSPAVDNRKLKIVYTLRPSVQVPSEVPFHSTFERVVTNEIWRTFRPRLMAATASRRR